MILQAFQKTIRQNHLEGKKFLLAVSGGVDSMVLTDLFVRSGLHCIVAHCNYHLRDEDSNADEQCVSDYCLKHHIPFFVQHFPLAEQQPPVNIQNEARKLRYAWFEQLKQEQGCHIIVTAHHQDDAIETLLMNFFKGTGIAGLHGIKMLHHGIFRPLIRMDKPSIYQYAAAQNILWREDKSNQKDDYTRNKIRNHLLPELAQIFPQIRSNLSENIERFAEAELLYEEAIAGYRKKLLQVRGNDIYIPVLRLKHCHPLPTILYELLRPYGFSPQQLPHALELLEAESGKYISSPDHRLIRDRNFLIITSLQTAASEHLLIERDQLSFDQKYSITTPHFTLELSLAKVSQQGLEKFPDNDSAWLDMDHLIFPLILRPRKTGDYFYPLGMGNKKKKVSRFLIDQKIPLHEKEKVWVLESRKKIAWLIGQRIDERFKINTSTRQIIKLRLVP